MAVENVLETLNEVNKNELIWRFCYFCWTCSSWQIVACYYWGVVARKYDQIVERIHNTQDNNGFWYTTYSKY